jgi:hypothetical protein
MFSGGLELEEKSVRGSLVVGLSDKDIRLLDIFEGNVSTDLSTGGTMAAEDTHHDCGRNICENWSPSTQWVPRWLSTT